VEGLHFMGAPGDTLPQGTLYPRGHFTPGDTLPCYLTVLKYKSHGRINADLASQVNQCEEY